MESTQRRDYIIADIMNLPDGVRAELIDGQIYYMSPPSRTHQKILGELYLEIGQYIKKSKGKCEVYPAPFSVHLDKDDKTYFEPDISVICDSDKLDNEGCKGAPDWIIEIVSPSNSSHDYVLKLNKYWTAGVREYWIVDPQTETVLVYFFESTVSAKAYHFQDKIKVSIYNDFYIDFSTLNINSDSTS